MKIKSKIWLILNQQTSKNQNLPGGWNNPSLQRHSPLPE